jgi:hypothetical protein
MVGRAHRISVSFEWHARGKCFLITADTFRVNVHRVVLKLTRLGNNLDPGSPSSWTGIFTSRNVASILCAYYDLYLIKWS